MKLGWRPRRCKILGFDQWGMLGPLRVVALTPSPGVAREVAVRSDGRFQATAGAVETNRGPDRGRGAGLVYARQRTSAHATARNRSRFGPSTTMASRWSTPASYTVSGGSAAGVSTVCAACRNNRHRLVGRTNADGRCVVTVPYGGKPFDKAGDNLLLLVAPDDRPAVVGGVWQRSFYVSDHRVPAIDGDELVFTCAAAAPIRGTIAGVPPGTVAQLSAVCKLMANGNGFLHDPRAFASPVQPDGSFEFSAVPTEVHSCWLTLLPPQGSRWSAPMFAPESERALPEDVVSLDRGERLLPECGEIDLRVVGKRGGPAQGAIAWVAAADRPRVMMRDCLVRVPLDGAGGARLRLIPGEWVVAVVTEDGFAAERIRVDGSATSVELSLAPLATTKVCLVDTRGEPIAGARVRTRGISTSGALDPKLVVLYSLAVSSRQQWKSLRTDEDGCAVIPFVPVANLEQRLQLRWDGGVTEDFGLTADQLLTLRPKQ